MAHALTAIIGTPAVIARIADAAGCPAPHALPFSLAIAPLGDANIDRLTDLRPGAYYEGFTYLSERLALVLSEATKDSPLAYIETDYSGGKGTQAAAVFDQRKMMPYASSHDAPINTALRALGVTAGLDQDEFDMLGLGRFRSFKDFSDGNREWELGLSRDEAG